MKKFLFYNLHLIIAGCLTVAVFAAVFSLYSLPVEAVVYASAITGFCFLAIGGFRFAVFRRKHLELLRLMDSVMHGVETLPPAGSLIEEDYQALLRLLDEERRLIVSETDRLRSDMEDYYSLWVHQIKTPIAAIRLLIQSEKDSKFKQEIEQQILRIEQYVDMALGYLRIESPSSDLVIARYSLGDIVRQAARKTSKLFIHGKTKLDLADGLGEVLTDEKWLCFVIEQLLSNALKYAAGGMVSVYNEGSKEGSMEDGQTLVIRDTGIGIAAEDIPRVFEKGYTGYNGRIGQKSTGIGLYLCKMILDKLSHTIKIESATGEGTTVSIGFNQSLP